MITVKFKNKSTQVIRTSPSFYKDSNGERLTQPKIQEKAKELALDIAKHEFDGYEVTI